MSEEKKIVELKEEELEEASGGYAEETFYSFEKGDCFSDNTYIYKVLHNYKKMDEKDNVECKWFDKKVWIKFHDKSSIRHENKAVEVRRLIGCNYEGVDYI